MKKFLALCLLLTTLLSLFSCGGTPVEVEELPEGMQIAEVGEGYTFYAPEKWVIDRTLGLTMAYVSAVDPSNITLVRVKTDKEPAAYFAESEADLRRTFADFFMNPDLSSDDAELGGKPAIVRLYSGKMNGTPYVVKQYLCREGEYIYLLTYTAKDEVPSGEVTYFKRYEETVDKVAKAFSFTGEPKPTEPAKPGEVVKNEDGLILISDPAISRYSLYVPEGWTVDLQNGITSATRDGAVLTLSYEVPKEENIDEYWTKRNEQYAMLFENYTPITDEWTSPVDKVEDIVCWLGGRQAVRRVFTFTHGGVTYKTQKLMTVDGIYIYTLTYTAAYREDGKDTYSTLYDDFEKIVSAFTFAR